MKKGNVRSLLRPSSPFSFIGYILQNKETSNYLVKLIFHHKLILVSLPAAFSLAMALASDALE